MKTTSICLSLVLMLAIVSCRKTTSDVNIIDEPFAEDQENIKAILVNIFDVAKAKDMDALDTYHLRGPKFSKFDDGGIPGRQDYETGKRTETEFFMGVSEFDYTLPDTKVDVFGNAAIATFIIDYNVALSDTTINGKSRGTLVFVKDNGQWKIAHEHFSPVINPNDLR